jgi:ribosomal protein L5
LVILLRKLIEIFQDGLGCCVKCKDNFYCGRIYEFFILLIYIDIQYICDFCGFSVYGLYVHDNYSLGIFKQFVIIEIDNDKLMVIGILKGFGLKLFLIGISLKI